MVNIIINPPKDKQNGLQEVLSNCKFPEVMDCDSRDQSIQLFPPKCFSQIQTSCNFEAYLYSCRHHLDQVYFQCCPLPGRFSHNNFLWLYNDTIMRNCFVCVVYKNFLSQGHSLPERCLLVGFIFNHCTVKSTHRANIGKAS